MIVKFLTMEKFDGTSFGRSACKDYAVEMPFEGLLYFTIFGMPVLVDRVEMWTVFAIRFPLVKRSKRLSRLANSV